MFGNRKKLDAVEAELCTARMLNDSLESELKVLKDRVRSVEDAYTQKTGLQIRNDITKVFTKFTKIEMIAMMSGMYALMKNSSNVADIAVYSELVQRIQGFIDKMEDDNESRG